MGIKYRKPVPAACVALKKDVKSIFCEIDEIRQEDTTIGEEPHDNTQYVDGVLKKKLENITDYTVVENADGTYTVTLPKTTETEKNRRKKCYDPSCE